MPRHMFGYAALAVVSFVMLVLAGCAVTTIPTGHVGVVTWFGEVTSDQLREGIHLINPLKAVTRMSVRTQEQKEVGSVPSSEGLLMHLEVSLIYRLDALHVRDVYQTIGPDYVNVLIAPTVRSVMRSVTAAHEASTLYGEARDQVAGQMLMEIRSALGPRGIVAENLLLRDIRLPDTLKAAIEAKQQADQEAQRMTFVLQRERQEAERKRIEAQGIADFQRIVTLGISAQLLEWKGIEATMDLAKSPNAKVVVIGNTKTGLPVIFSGQ